MPKDGASQVAYCAEYDSQEDEEVASTRRHATGTSVPEQANITAKRTTDTQGSASTSPRQNSRDLASDSGYSSRTHGTSASAESGKSATALPSTTMDAKPTATVTAGGSPQASASASKPALSRASSKSSHRVRKCAEPDCAKCKRGRMLKQAAAESSQKAPSQAEPQPDERARSTEKRPPTPAATQPQARPPLRSASTSRARPRSMYDAPREPQSAGAGPPLSYWNPARYPYYAQGYMTGAGNFMVTDRPGLPHRATDGTMPSARTPANAVGTPFVTYDPGATERLSARRPAKKMHPAVGYEHGVVDDEDEDEDETADSEEYDSPEDQYRRMLRERQNELEAFEARRRLTARRRRETNAAAASSSTAGAFGLYTAAIQHANVRCCCHKYYLWRSQQWLRRRRSKRCERPGLCDWWSFTAKKDFNGVKWQRHLDVAAYARQPSSDHPRSSRCTSSVVFRRRRY